MPNSWSLLFDVMEEREKEASPDYAELPETNENREVVITTMNNQIQPNQWFWKYNEGNIIRDLENYLIGTYKGHYTSDESKVQTLDLIEAIGDSESFCRSNAIKYLSRFGKKNGKNKLDLLKALHYTVLLYHFSGLDTDSGSENVDTTSPLGY